mgnify:CR=1 FL=1
MSGHEWDGANEDNPEQRPPAYVDRRACGMLADDLKELSGMSESDKRRYCGGASV